MSYNMLMTQYASKFKSCWDLFQTLWLLRKKMSEEGLTMYIRNQLAG